MAWTLMKPTRTPIGADDRQRHGQVRSQADQREADPERDRRWPSKDRSEARQAWDRARHDQRADRARRRRTRRGACRTRRTRPRTAARRGHARPTLIGPVNAKLKAAIRTIIDAHGPDRPRPRGCPSAIVCEHARRLRRRSWLGAAPAAGASATIGERREGERGGVDDEGRARSPPARPARLPRPDR